MPTVSELNGQLQSLLKKGARPTADATDGLKWYNECLRRLQIYTHIPGTWNVTLTGLTETYSLAVASYPIHLLTSALYIETGDTEGSPLELKRLEERWIDNTVRFKRALPIETNHTLYVYPSDLAGTLELYGEVKLDTLADENSIPVIREDFHDILPLFAAMRFGGQDEDFQGGRYDAFAAEYARRLGEYVKEMAGDNGPSGFQTELRW